MQNLANAEEIWITDEVFDSAGVAELVRDRQLSAEDARLRGIEQVVRVYRISRPARRTVDADDAKAAASALPPRLT